MALPAEVEAIGDAQKDDAFVQSVARGLSVVRAFRPGRERLTIAEIAHICGLTRAGVRRILLTLEELGYVGQDGRHFYLTTRILDLAKGYERRSLWEAVRPVLQGLTAELNESSSAGVLDGDDVVYMVRIKAERLMVTDVEQGARLPAFVSAMGRMLLARLPAHALDERLRRVRLAPLTPHTVRDLPSLRERIDAARRQGWCCAKGEVEETLSCAAVPLVDREGQTLAALHVAFGTERASDERVRTIIVPALQRAADKIAAVI